MDLRASLTKGTVTGLKVIWELAKVIVPAMVIINVLDKTGAITYISHALGPVMSIFGVPGEGSLVIVSANFVSFYAGLATLVALHLPWRSLTILATMMMLCHGATYETALAVKAGARGGVVLGARAVAMVVVGILLNLVLPGR